MGHNLTGLVQQLLCVLHQARHDGGGVEGLRQDVGQIGCAQHDASALVMLLQDLWEHMGFTQQGGRMGASFECKTLVRCQALQADREGLQSSRMLVCLWIKTQSNVLTEVSD